MSHPCVRRGRGNRVIPASRQDAPRDGPPDFGRFHSPVGTPWMHSGLPVVCHH